MCSFVAKANWVLVGSKQCQCLQTKLFDALFAKNWRHYGDYGSCCRLATKAMINTLCNCVINQLCEFVRIKM